MLSCLVTNLPDSRHGAVLDAASIRRLLAGDRPLLRGMRALEQQIQPNGVDLTVASLWSLDGAGSIGMDNRDRVLPSLTELTWDRDGWLDLARGPYLARLHEIVELPTDLMALGQARSSLLRSGVAIHNAVWDAGYIGRSEVLLVVCNDHGFRVQRDARILQLVFCRLAAPTTRYVGRFQGENLGLHGANVEEPI